LSERSHWYGQATSKEWRRGIGFNIEPSLFEGAQNAVDEDALEAP